MIGCGGSIRGDNTHTEGGDCKVTATVDSAENVSVRVLCQENNVIGRVISDVPSV